MGLKIKRLIGWRVLVVSSVLACGIAGTMPGDAQVPLDSETPLEYRGFALRGCGRLAQDRNSETRWGPFGNKVSEEVRQGSRRRRPAGS